MTRLAVLFLVYLMTYATIAFPLKDISEDKEEDASSSGCSRGSIFEVIGSGNSGNTANTGNIQGGSHNSGGSNNNINFGDAPSKRCFIGSHFRVIGSGNSGNTANTGNIQGGSHNSGGNNNKIGSGNSGNTVNTGKMQGGSGNSGGNLCSGKAIGNYPDPRNCCGYIACSNSITYHMPCPATLKWNDNNKRCDWPQFASPGCSGDACDGNSSDAPSKRCYGAYCKRHYFGSIGSHNSGNTANTGIMQGGSGNSGGNNNKINFRDAPFVDSRLE